jgi:sugar phosphate isomerase/epimerase
VNLHEETPSTKAIAMTNAPLLFPAVMTSSSDRDLEDLFDEVRLISNVDRFDLMVARRSDLRQLTALNGKTGRFERMAQVIADPQCFREIRRWLIAETDRHDVRVPALASYYPDIAVAALANAVQLAIDLAKRRRGTVPGEQRMDHAIVEIVCGTVVDPGPEGPESPRRLVYDQDYKLDLLCCSLTEVIRRVREQVGESAAFALALETEPGETYVLNSVASIRKMLERLEGTAPVEGANADWLCRHVGLNLDIAHMRIARIKASELRPFADRIVHAHISDHPGMHTHDQIVGSWTHPGRLTGGYREYLDLLLDRAQSARCQERDDKKSLPFSGAVAVELEGCDRVFWIHDSLARLKHAIQLATARRGQTQESASDARDA